MGAAWSIPWTFLPLYLEAIGFSKTEIGSVHGAEAWGRALAALPAAYLFAKRRTTPVLTATSLLSTLAYFALPWVAARNAPAAGAAAASVHAIVTVNLLRGFLDQVHHVAIAPFLFRHTSWRARATAFALSEAVHTATAVLGSFGAGRIVAWLAPRLARPTAALTTGDGETDAMALVLMGAALLPLAAAFVFSRIVERDTESAQRPPLVATLRRHYALLLRFSVPRLFMAAGAGLSIPFLGLYFRNRFGVEAGTVGTLNACGQVLVTTGFLFTPAILRRLGFVRGVLAVELGSIPFFLVLAFTRSLPLAIAAFLLRGALMNTAHPMFNNLMMQAVPGGLREIQNGIQSLVWGLGWLVGSTAGGVLLDATDNDYSILMSVTVALYLATSIASFTLLGPVERGLPDDVRGRRARTTTRVR